MSDELSQTLSVSKGYAYLVQNTRIRGVRAHAPRPLSSGQLAKCTIDLILAGLAFIILLPVFFAIALAVQLDGGPVFYVQPRVGRGGRSFKCYKFRSMRVNADELLANVLLSNADEAESWRINRKLRNDPRVTPVGKFLRKTSLDELPQLLNILRMDMSLVGPRPIVEQEVHLYGADVCKYYSCRPGLTGVWQISGRSDTTFQERVGFDTSYVDNWSVWLDLRIILKTVPAVLAGSGAR